ncbi:MAG: prolyl oligopeptidase family serine peptidase, partial [Bacteroidota bacterium]
QSVYDVGGKLLCRYYNRGSYAVSVFSYEGENLYSYKFPTGYSLGGFWGLPSDTSVRFYQSSYYLPPVVFTFNINTYKIESAGITEPYFDTKKYVTRIVNYKSKDGTLVPMYLSHKRGLKPAKTNPVILYGYGGFGESLTPNYDYSNIILFENNGILAIPLIRGGGELGHDWHAQGKVLNKQNSFDDFIRAAEYLIDSGYTSTERIAIQGGSNGGLLVGAVLAQRPELFKVVVGEMGLYDMLRYHYYTGSGLWDEEYGTIKDSAQFMNLFRYSPLHNIKKGVDYPATLLVTGENDDRVPPFHSYKFVSALQQNSSNTKPHVLYYEEDGGHSGAYG